MKPTDLGALAKFGDAQPSLLRLATCHPSGYVREASLKALENTFDGAELPFLLIRLNDWVAPVGKLALAHVRRRARLDYAKHLVRCLPLVRRLSELGRAAHTEIVEMIRDVLCHPDSREALLEGTTSADRQVRRMAYRLGVERSDPSLSDLLRTAIEDEDPVVRLWASRHVVDAFGPDLLPEILDTLERDPFMAVRRQALDLRLEHLTDTAEPKLREFLFDRSAGIRGYCQYHIQRRFQCDPAIDYRRFLAPDASRLRECILGLGEVGKAADAGRLEAYLDEPRTRIFSAAIRSVARLSTFISHPAPDRSLPSPRAAERGGSHFEQTRQNDDCLLCRFIRALDPSRAPRDLPLAWNPVLLKLHNNFLYTDRPFRW